MEKKELSEVVHLAKANNEEAITELLKRFEPLIASMNHHYFFHEMDQEDFAQEARVMMLRALDKYNEDHAVSFAGYYQRCLKNLAVECLRREHRQRVVPHNLLIHGDKGELALMSAAVESCEKQVFLHEDAEEYFHHLSRFEREVFLGVLDGQTFEEMADHFDKSVTSVKGAHKRCKKKFKEQICRG